VIKQLDIHGRHAAKLGNFELFNDFHRFFGIPAAEQDQLSSGQEFQTQGEDP